jgi:biopolymer transport protein ExbD
MKVKSSSSDEEAQVQMAPLIDCVFLLLIFFLVAATLKRAHNEMPVRVADTSASLAPDPEYKPLVVEVRTEGDFYVNYVPVTGELVQQILRETAAENPSQVIRIDADRRTAWQHVVRLVDLCRFEGLRNIMFRTGD